MTVNIQPLVDLIARLRHPETGCEWDLAQTANSLLPMTQDELYELFDAIQSNEPTHVCEELGDVLFHLAFYARIAEEQGTFNLQSVIDAVVDKMVRRHPHIFAGKVYANREEQKADWHRIKAKEKASEVSPYPQLSAITDEDFLSKSIIGKASFEQSLQAQALLATLGFDWSTASPVVEKIREECDELEEVLDEMLENSHDDTNKEKTLTKMTEEYGDLLFAVVNLGRKLSISPDAALRQANHKFLARSQAMLAMSDGADAFAALSLSEKEALWQRVKQGEMQGEKDEIQGENQGRVSE
ncbi:nucleoside triphosphate pyrophosphohydrolase [Ostreibacterium oceani]|uniref:Nucleoside triphosphate pyrophosphohydrolase n=1 Tax=Ostreibacterium oceani TaxID=2654998 RepID=A0A6N7F458_9GAMM|nr:nucleoside triphosphate pyrophosphohydrolase [Ostreibacterium oceani]MPV86666.1 nucleoside triphosphate pyrophosphohydrolase [Ostreibacterium oceani]